MNNLTAPRSRITSIDLLRGLVMMIMALDHVRDYFHDHAFLRDPLDLKITTPALYFTRWVTHFCAPTFLLLAGTSAYLMSLKMSKPKLSVFLIKRGFWLIFVEVVIMAFIFSFNPSYNALILQVIWATGISMIILGLMVRLPFTVILVTGLIIVLGHNLLDYPEAAEKGHIGLLWDLIHHGRFTVYSLDPNHVVVIAYAFLPWTGIMLMGYCMGKLFERSFDPSRRRKILITTGTVLTIFFVIIRWINAYGDPFPWTVQRDHVFTFLSFLNVNKYPPSLAYVSITIGPALVFMGLAENIKGKISSSIIIFGRVPMFYYVLHFFVVHVLSMIARLFSGMSVKEVWVVNFPFRPPFGYDLWAVYLFWILVLIIMYPLCKKYDKYKSTHHYWWLSYL
ncbi:MAG: DUF1624 domain-containing protein [Bacteroidetes bacterium]|nr:DUF1624 domain-containing protein [Bacteroidota bacterium]